MPDVKRTASLLAIALLLVLAQLRTAEAEDRLQVYAVNYPVAYFAERIAGDLAEVRFPAPADVDPAFWMPDADTIVAYQAADLILLNGADYAKWANKVSLPRSRLVDTSRGFRDAYIRQPMVSVTIAVPAASTPTAAWPLPPGSISVRRHSRQRRSPAL